MLTIVASVRSPHQSQHQKILQQGLYKLGISSICATNQSVINTKYVACWGWRNGKIFRDAGHEVLVMERGYIGDRFKFTSLAWNGLNGYAEFPEYEYDSGARFKGHGVKIKPWKMGGSYALILGQVPSDASLQGKDIMPWYEEQAAHIKAIYDIPVYFRSHPDLIKKGIRQKVEGTLPSEGTLEQALNGAAFTVTYNSNSSVDSILNGTPCIIGDKGSMAYDMCGKFIGDLVRPYREVWAHKLAQKQWSLSEIQSGEALKGIICRLGL